LEHVCGCHDNCHKSLCYDKEAQQKYLVYVPPKEHRITKEDSKTYNQLLDAFNQYANLTQMTYCNHPFDTQTNKSLNQVIPPLHPKMSAILAPSAFSTTLPLLLASTTTVIFRCSAGCSESLASKQL
jgi:hypothetical protein